jgi:flagellar basal body rod protein FlgC
MKSITAIASSGMNAALLTMSASANNIANAVVPVYRRQQVIQEAQPGGGVSASVTQAEVSGSDLATDIVQQRVALYSFKANLRSVQIEKEMLGTLFDEKA